MTFTLEMVEVCRKALIHPDDNPKAVEKINAICDLAKLALSPPNEIGELVKRLKLHHENYVRGVFVGYGSPINPDGHEAADTLLSLSARIRGLEAGPSTITDAMIDAAMDAADGHFDIDGDKGPWLRTAGWEVAFTAMFKTWMESRRAATQGNGESHE